MTEHSQRAGTVESQPTLDVALQLVAAGRSVIPIGPNKLPMSKLLPRLPDDRGRLKPTWKPFQERIAGDTELHGWYGNGTSAGIGVLAGSVSGNLEIIDVDDAETYETYACELERVAPGLLGRLTQHETPRPGRHLIYRCSVIERNQKLACVPFEEIDPKTGKTKVKPRAIIETRGEGGYIVAPGSPASCHPTGRVYRHVAGPPMTAVATITPAERDILFILARAMNQCAENAYDPSDRNKSVVTPGILRPGDDFNARADWRGILEPHGWSISHTSGSICYWRRAGSAHPYGATTGYCGDRLYVFSTNASPLDSERAHSKFAAFTALNHGGDFKAATRALVGRGYGTSAAQDYSGNEPEGDQVPELIILDTEEHRGIEEGIRALSRDEDVYQRGGVLVRALRNHSFDDGIIRPDGSMTISRLPPANLRERLTRVARFVTIGRKGEAVAAHPAAWLVDGIDARGHWLDIRRLEGLSEVPVLRPDGTIWQTVGYDARTGVLYAPTCSFPPISDELRAEDAEQAAAELLEVVCDFPFENDAHRAAWVAGLLTLLGRFAFEGPAPLFLVDANTRGAGKSLLVQAIGRIAFGREIPVSSYTHAEEEMRKRITSLAIAGDRGILLDNLEGDFGNAALDRALTSTRWKDRMLGKNQDIDLPLSTVWFATGNNVVIAADTIRRVIHVRLDVLVERPEERADFRHADLLGWICQHRGRLLVNALVMLAAYIRAARPRFEMPAFGSFEGWSGLVRGTLLYAGLPDPCQTRASLAQTADLATEGLAQLLNAWENYEPWRNGVVLAKALPDLYGDGSSDPASRALRAALDSLTGCSSGERASVREVGNRFRTFRRRVFGGRMIDGIRGKLGTVWRLVQPR